MTTWLAGIVAMAVAHTVGKPARGSPMLRTSSCAIALAAIVAGPTAQAADTTLTLACSGAATDISMSPGSTDITIPAGKPEPTSMGIIINFTARTVAGLDFPLKITSSDETTIFFEGSHDTELTARKISGSIDRVTGDMKAVSIKIKKNTFISLDVAYALKCRPTQRMF
jgi:hypothetical protein